MDIATTSNDIVQLNLSGRVFCARRQKLYLSKFLKGVIEYAERSNLSQPFFVERSAMIFEEILAFLLDDSHPIPVRFYSEVLFYQIPTFSSDWKTICSASNKCKISLPITLKEEPAIIKDISTLPIGWYESVMITTLEKIDTWQPWVWSLLPIVDRRQVTLNSQSEIGVFIDGKQSALGMMWSKSLFKKTSWIPKCVVFEFSYRPIPDYLQIHKEALEVIMSQGMK